MGIRVDFEGVDAVTKAVERDNEQAGDAIIAGLNALRAASAAFSGEAGDVADAIRHVSAQRLELGWASVQRVEEMCYALQRGADDFQELEASVVDGLGKLARRVDELGLGGGGS